MYQMSKNITCVRCTRGTTVAVTDRSREEGQFELIDDLRLMPLSLSRSLVRSRAALLESLTRRQVHVKSWRVPTVTNGQLKVRLRHPCVFRVYVQNPHVHDWNQALVDLHVDRKNGDKTDENVCMDEARTLADAFGPRVAAYSREAQTTTVTIDTPDIDIEKSPTFSWTNGDPYVALHVGIPGMSSLDISTAGDGDIRMEGALEGDVRIRAERANVQVEKVKASVFDADLGNGSLCASVLQATSVIRAGNGTVTIRRAQGPLVKVNSGSGDVSIEALYTSVADIQSHSGKITLSGSQGTVRVSSKSGDVRVEGVEGRLDVDSEHGSVHMTIAAVSAAHVRATHGDVSVGLPSPPLRAVLTLSAQQVEVDDKVQFTPKEVKSHGESRRKDGIQLCGETNVRSDEDSSNLEIGHAFVHVDTRHGKISVEQREWGLTLRSLWQEVGVGSPSEGQKRGDS